MVYNLAWRIIFLHCSKLAGTYSRRRFILEDYRMPATEKPPVTYILPTIAWASLLDIIVRDAPSEAVIEVHTLEMERVTEQTLHRLERQDLEVRFIPHKSRR